MLLAIPSPANALNAWTKAPQPTGVQLLSLAFTDLAHGWAVGYDGHGGGASFVQHGIILVTADGGQHWTVQSDVATDAVYAGVSFADSLHGWVVGQPGEVLSTDDGGSHWVSRLISDQLGFEPFLRTVVFVDSEHGWAAGSSSTGEPTILATADGGAHWSPQYLSHVGGEFKSISFADAAHGWAVGTSGLALATSDGGLHWTPQDSGTTNDLLSVCFASQTDGLAVGDKGTILHTVDGGLHWIAQASGASVPLRAVAFPDVMRGWAVGSNVVLATTDGGSHWEVKQLPVQSDALYCLAFADVNHGWAGGAWGTFLTYGDVPDTSPPVTASNAVSSYIGTATISLTATDGAGGSGVAHTYYKLDGVVHEGLVAIISSLGLRTMEYWSTDFAGNEELPHKTVAFTVLPPVISLPKASVSTPTAPSTMYRGRSYAIYGYVAPKHTGGTYLVTLKFYKRNSSGTYVYHHSVNAKRVSYSSSAKSKYSAKTSLASKGRWRVRAYHACSKHAGAYGGYDYITVK